MARTTPTVHVISDSLGDTACEVVLAAAGQFPDGAVRIKRLPKVTSAQQVREYITGPVESGEAVAVFHTIANRELRSEIREVLDGFGVPSIDLLGPAVNILSALTGLNPSGAAGMLRKTDERYFHRIEAMEYFVGHDNGHNLDDIDQADVVLFGVDHTGKTPLAMSLAMRGFKVANVRFELDEPVPEALGRVDAAKVVGLTSDPKLVFDLRSKNPKGNNAVTLDQIAEELRQAEQIMDERGFYKLQTHDKTVEECAQAVAAHFDQD